MLVEQKFLLEQMLPPPSNMISFICLQLHQHSIKEINPKIDRAKSLLALMSCHAWSYPYYDDIYPFLFLWLWYLFLFTITINKRPLGSSDLNEQGHMLRMEGGSCQRWNNTASTLILLQNVRWLLEFFF